MNLALIISLSVINFLLTAIWLIRRKRDKDYPLWLYIIAALLCWFPIVIPYITLKVENFISGRKVPQRKVTASICAILIAALGNGIASYICNNEYASDTISLTISFMVIFALTKYLGKGESSK